jgi:molybdate/tungstate transport system permease protein
MPSLTPHRRLEPLHLIFSVLGGVVLLFILAPLVGVFVNCSWEQTRSALDAEVAASIWLTIWVSMAATLLLAVAAIPFAWVLARKNFPCRRLVNAIVDLPIVIPHSAAGIAILGLVARDTFLGRVAEKLGFGFVGAPAGIMAAMAFVSIPFLINAARDGFAAVPERLEKTALSLGASPLRVFMTISLPLAWRSVLSGLVLMWARGLSEFGAVVIVAYHPMITPVLIFTRYNDFGLKYARPVAAVFILVCLALFIVLRLMTPGNAARRHQGA